MNVGLLAVDSQYPNLALMKLSTWHKLQGDTVEWYNPLCRYDKVYMAKVFNFTPDYGYYVHADEVERGGTGYDLKKTLPKEIDRILMDNNILASDYGLSQIEKIVRRKLRVDFNQGLDAHLVTDDVARMLARVKWIKRIRFGCDTPGQIADCERATTLIDRYGYKGEYFFYCILLDDFRESFNRVNHWRAKGRRFLPHAQPYRDPDNSHQVVPQWQKDLAGWADKKWIFRTCEFRDFEPRKGFKCNEYFM